MKDGVPGRFFPGDVLPLRSWGCLGRCRHLGSTLWAEHRRSPAAGSGAEPRESGAHWNSDDLQPGLCLDWGCHGMSWDVMGCTEFFFGSKKTDQSLWCFNFSDGSDGECAVLSRKMRKVLWMCPSRLISCQHYCKLLYRRDCPRNWGLATTHTHKPGSQPLLLPQFSYLPWFII